MTPRLVAGYFMFSRALLVAGSCAGFSGGALAEGEGFEVSRYLIELVMFYKFIFNFSLDIILVSTPSTAIGVKRPN
jgi:hypothetical protein